MKRPSLIERKIGAIMSQKGNRKKLTYKELANYIVNFEQQAKNAVNTISQTMADYIEFSGETKKFMEFLKTKYERKSDANRKKDTSKKK